jgi:hypothetical protein
MSNNLMAGRIASGNNEEIRKILAGCFKRDLKERLSPLQLLEAINKEITRQERAGLMRPQTVQPEPTNSTTKLMEQSGQLQLEGTRRSPRNNHMIASEFPSEKRENSRSQSPFQTRFVNQLNHDPRNTPSPPK